MITWCKYLLLDKNIIKVIVYCNHKILFYICLKKGAYMRVEKNNKTKREKSEYAVQAVINAIDILELLGNCEHELSMSEIVSTLELTKSNVNKLLANLERYGYVEHNKYTGNFRLGVKTFQISQAYINKLNLIDISNQVLIGLKNKLNESTYIGVLRHGNVVYLNMIETDEPVRVMPRIGNVGPAYATAIGKAQLSTLTNKEITALYENKQFRKLTEKTVSNIDELLEDIAHIRECGYALDLEEYEYDVHCVAAPVLDFMGKVIAGISVSGPKVRMGMDRIEKEIAPILIEAAKELSGKFGYVDSDELSE